MYNKFDENLNNCFKIIFYLSVQPRDFKKTQKIRYYLILDRIKMTL